jgi:hypothetical protein
VPAVVSVSTRVDDDTLTPLHAAGFVEAPLSEPLMWLDARPLPSASEFEVRRITTGQELVRAIEVAAEAHAFERAMLTGLLARGIVADGDVATWIAWGEEAASVIWLTRDSQIGVWQMNTLPRHRRRGAARATLTAALNELWDDETEGAFLWATPAGRALYERVGFTVVDERRVWVLGGDADGSLAVGQTG